jgi:F0F1-type ATP synthase assembly protein I
MSPRRDDDRKPGGLRDIGLYATIPGLLLAGPAVGVWLGVQAQHRWGHDPWFLLGGIAFGLAAAIRQIIKIIRQGSQDD